MAPKDGRDRALVAIEEKLNVRTAFEGEGCGGQDDRWPVITPHRIQRYANVACHSLVRPHRARCPDGAARRDNSGSAAQGNARSCARLQAAMVRFDGAARWASQGAMPAIGRGFHDSRLVSARVGDAPRPSSLAPII